MTGQWSWGTCIFPPISFHVSSYSYSSILIHVYYSSVRIPQSCDVYRSTYNYVGSFLTAIALSQTKSYIIIRKIILQSTQCNRNKKYSVNTLQLARLVCHLFSYFLASRAAILANSEAWSATSAVLSSIFDSFSFRRCSAYNEKVVIYQYPINGHAYTPQHFVPFDLTHPYFLLSCGISGPVQHCHFQPFWLVSLSFHFPDQSILSLSYHPACRGYQ